MQHQNAQPGSATVVDMKPEVVVIPASDMERAEARRHALRRGPVYLQSNGSDGQRQRPNSR